MLVGVQLRLAGALKVRLLPVLDDGKWVCFRTQNHSQLHSYIKLQIDLTEPSFTLIQVVAKVGISSLTGLSDYGYFQADSDPGTTDTSSCSKNNTISTWTASTTGTTKTDIVHGKWICFRAKNTKGVYGYG